MSRRKVLLGFAVLFLAALLVTLAITLSGPPAHPPLPDPNGYDDLVKASETVAGDVGNFQTLDHDSLRALVSTNAASLRVLRLGLTRQCIMPMDSALTNEVGRLNQLSGMKRLVQLLAAEGRMREMDNQAADAANSYMDAMRFGNEMSRGGFVITRLVGIACESIGCHALAKVMPGLSGEQARVVLAELEKVDADHVTWDEVLRSERCFARYQLRNTLNPIPWVMAWWQSRQAMERAETKHGIVIAHERLLAAELALRCYQSEKATVPTRLDELATNYLGKVPLDPFTSQRLIYRPRGTNWLLYSVGPDGVDDGGRLAGRGWPVKGDILFDSSW